MVFIRFFALILMWAVSLSPSMAAGVLSKLAPDPGPEVQMLTRGLHAHFKRAHYSLDAAQRLCPLGKYTACKEQALSFNKFIAMDLMTKGEAASLVRFYPITQSENTLASISDYLRNIIKFQFYKANLDLYKLLIFKDDVQLQDRDLLNRMHVVLKGALEFCEVGKKEQHEAHRKFWARGIHSQREIEAFDIITDYDFSYINELSGIVSILDLLRKNPNVEPLPAGKRTQEREAWWKDVLALSESMNKFESDKTVVRLKYISRLATYIALRKKGPEYYGSLFYKSYLSGFVTPEEVPAEDENDGYFKEKISNAIAAFDKDLATFEKRYTLRVSTRFTATRATRLLHTAMKEWANPFSIHRPHKPDLSVASGASELLGPPHATAAAAAAAASASAFAPPPAVTTLAVASVGVTPSAASAAPPPSANALPGAGAASAALSLGLNPEPSPSDSDDDSPRDEGKSDGDEADKKASPSSSSAASSASPAAAAAVAAAAAGGGEAPARAVPAILTKESLRSSLLAELRGKVSWDDAVTAFKKVGILGKSNKAGRGAQWRFEVTAKLASLFPDLADGYFVVHGPHGRLKENDPLPHDYKGFLKDGIKLIFD